MGKLTLIVVPATPAGLTDALVDAAFQAQTGYEPVHIIRWQDTRIDPEWADYYDPADERRRVALSNGRL